MAATLVQEEWLRIEVDGELREVLARKVGPLLPRWLALAGHVWVIADRPVGNVREAS